MYKALIVGAGDMGRIWGKNLQDCAEVTIVGWVDIRPGLAAQAAAELALATAYTGVDLNQALAQVHPDFVVDVTSPEAHYSVTLCALAAGIPVLGEKPMAVSMAHAQEMVAASERAGKLFMVNQDQRYSTDLQAMRRLIVEQVGPPGILNSDFYIGAHFGGFRDEMMSPLLMDMAIHTMDAARYLSGANPVAVYCEEFNPPWSWYRGNACATAIFEMTGGLLYTYRGSWCSEGHHTSWEAEWRAVGPHGTAIWDSRGEPSAEIVVGMEGFHRQTETRRVEGIVDRPSGIAGSLRDFLFSLETGKTPMGECHDNIWSLAMVCSAIQSAASRQRVTITV